MWTLAGELLLSLRAEGVWGIYCRDVYVIWAQKFVVGFLGQSNLRQKQVGLTPEAG